MGPGTVVSCNQGLKNMASRLIEEQNVPVTSQEAEAILELWAKRQRENEELRSRTTVKDLAEAMGAPTTEVLALLGEVRTTPVSPVITPAERAVRRRNRFLMAGAAVIWLGFIVYVVGAAASSRQIELATTSTPVRVVRDRAANLPPESSGATEKVATDSR